MEVIQPTGVEDEAPLSSEGIFIFPVSYAQKALWLMSRFEPLSAAYNIATAFRLTGTLDVDVLERCLNEIVRRHEVLRTTIAMIEERLVQIVYPSHSLRIASVELGHLHEHERALRVTQLATEHAQEPFDLSRLPLIRVKLLRLTPSEYVLLLSMHHIIADGWSVGVFVRELATLYRSFSAGQSSPLSELSLQYADYAIWQEEWLKGEVLETQLSYWRRQLAGMPAVLELPSDRSRPAVESFKGETYSVALSTNLTTKLKALSRREDTTLFMTLLAAFQTLLYRYTGQPDVVVGSPIANRNQAEIEQLIGFFVNTLVMRTDLSGNPRFNELMQRVREMTLAAYEHQDMPFERLVEELQPERDLSRSPLFQVMFILQNTPGAELELGGLSLSRMEVDNRTAKFDLTLSMLEEAGGGLSGSLEYNTDLFDASSIWRLADHFEVILSAIVAEPQQRIEDLPLMSSLEREQVVVKWNRTAESYGQDQCFDQLFDEQVARTPEAVAVQYAGEYLNFAELNARSNQLAHYLRSLGVGADTLVGICVERSLEMVVGLLGIMKSGAAYVPLDPAYPQQRVALVMADSEIAVLLTQRHLVSQLPVAGVDVVCLDSDWETISRQSEQTPARISTAANLAYTIYTSGSTGQPKGVQISHRALTNFLCSVQREPGFTADDVLISVTTLSFDMAGLELYRPLMIGARLVIASRETAADGRELAQAIADSGATVMQATPATWRMLLDAEWAGSKKLKMVCGGEALSGELAQKLLARGAELWNIYGPTETTIWSTLKRVEQVSRGIVELGRPIANTQIYILDGRQQPVPVGVPGELYIGGDGLARGYIHRADLTAERFVPDPFSEEGGRRLYRTGDRARYLADGQIEFLGRLDHQVKIRGHRIELGEIEVALEQHPSVGEAIVVARSEADGDQRLVAYVVADPATEMAAAAEMPETAAQHAEVTSQWQMAWDQTYAQAAAPPADPTLNFSGWNSSYTGAPSLEPRLRNYLGERLPSYMIPSAFVLLSQMPLTPNGKVNRRELAQLAVGAVTEETYVAPRNEIEESVAATWAEVLGVSQVGVQSNFFELGGHSLRATQVISRLNKRFGVELSLRSLFQAPTVAALAEKIAAVSGTESTEAVIPIARISRQGNHFPLSFGQLGLWFFHRLNPGSAAYNIPTSLRLRGGVDIQALERTLTEIVRRHEVLRTTFSSAAGEPVQIIHPPSAITLPVHDLSFLPQHKREPEARKLVRVEMHQPFDLSTGPLLRAGLISFDIEEHVLLLTMHHIIFDVWSMGVLLREVVALYLAFAAGQASPLAELEIQYVDYAVWQREWLTSEVPKHQLSYWKQQLADPAVLNLPTDRPRPSRQSLRAAQLPFKLSKKLSDSLNALSRREGVTLFMTLLAAFQTLLHRYTGQDDILVGAPVTGRSRAETENLIGFFVNTLVLRSDLSGNPAFIDLLHQVRETTLQAQAHQDLPFGKLVEELNPSRDPSRQPLFQVLMDFKDPPVSSLKLGQLILSPTDYEAHAVVRTDLDLHVWETAGGIHGNFMYAADLFEPATIDRMSKRFTSLLESVVQAPESPLHELQME